MKTMNIEYTESETLLEGYLAYNEDDCKNKPIVLIAHAWLGRDEYACKKAEELAELGYIAFAMDVYGKGIIGSHHNEGAALKAPYMEDRALLRRRLIAGLETATEMGIGDTSRLAVMGYCFGGMCALDLARSGLGITGAISVHGLFDPIPDNNNETIKAKVLALHGHEDPLISPELFTSFQNEMTKAQADWQIHSYGHTGHAFTNPNADGTVPGIFYDAVADRRSWVSIKNFLHEIFTQ